MYLNYSNLSGEAITMKNIVVEITAENDDNRTEGGFAFICNVKTKSQLEARLKLC